MVRAQSEVQFRPLELATELQVGYAVRPVDVNGDGRLDIAIVDSKRVLWLENPSWKEHVVFETPEARYDNVCFAPHDINQDGRIDFALGADWQFNNTNDGGTIGWLEHTSQGPWRYHAIDSEPTTHRMNWADLDGDGTQSLIVAPLKGRGTRRPGFDQVGIRLLAFEPIMSKIRQRDSGGEAWRKRVLTEALHVMHNFDPSDFDGDGKTDLLTASYEGATWLSVNAAGEVNLQAIGSGQQQPAPKRGSSEIRLGRLGDGTRYVATVEPWHGDKVVVYLAQGQGDRAASEQQAASNSLWKRFVIDDQLAWGHAVVCANLDKDADQELIIGVRDDQSEAHRRGLRIYDPIDPAAGDWRRQIVDPGGVAIEDLTVADFDADGDNDIVAVGRQTHNVKIYWNQLH